MNDTQLFLAIGISSLLVVLNIIQSNRLSDKVYRLFGDSSFKIDRVATDLSSRIDRVATGLSSKIGRLAADNHRDHLMLMRDQVALNERVAKVETRLDGK